MSLAPLMGLPGKVKTLLDRLTATRAGNLDNLNATVSSRAPSATALSTANWTNTRAINLDNLNTTVSSRATQASVDVVDANVDSILASVSGGSLIKRTSLGGFPAFYDIGASDADGNYRTLLDLSASGWVYGIQVDNGSNLASLPLSTQIYLDNVLVFSASTSNVTNKRIVYPPPVLDQSASELLYLPMPLRFNSRLQFLGSSSGSFTSGVARFALYYTREA